MLAGHWHESVLATHTGIVTDCRCVLMSKWESCSGELAALDHSVQRRNLSEQAVLFEVSALITCYLQTPGPTPT